MTSHGHAITEPKGGRELGPDDQWAETPAASGPSTDSKCCARATNGPHHDPVRSSAKCCARATNDADTPPHTGGARRETTIFEEVLARIAARHLLVYPADLANETGRSPGSVYRECQRMAESGWLSRSNLPGDISYRGGEQLWRLLTALINGAAYEGEQASRTIAAANDSIHTLAARLQRAIAAAREQTSTPRTPAQGDAR